MSFFKAALAIAAVAGVGYAGYKTAKKHPRAAAAVLSALANSGSTPTRHHKHDTTVHVTETKTVIVADESKMEGVMGTTARAKRAPTTVRVHGEDDDLFISVDRPVLGMMETIDYADGESMFGGDAAFKFPR
jgi:hypothetical protein